jgi:hypothetical protein
MKKIFIFLFLLGGTLSSHSQTEDVPYFLKNTSLDLGLSFAKSQFSGSLAWTKLHGIGKNGNLKIGYGVRFSSYFGTNQNYLTAPAKITGASDFNNDYDTVRFKSAQMNSLNAAIYLQYSIKKLDIGFNIDALGFTFGSAKTGDYSSVKYKPKSQPNIIKYETTTEAKPTAFNALLVGDNDLGMLTSELMLRYWITEKVGVKVAGNFLFTEYTTDKLLRGETNDRYRNKSLMLSVGVSFKIK